MPSLRLRGVAVVVLLIAASGCKKEGATGDSMALPAELAPHPAQGDPARLAVPPLFANIPADTPYLLAGMASFPPELLARIQRGLAPVVAPLVQQWQSLAGQNKVLAAIVAELDGKCNQAGLESLGFSSEPRFAIYGLGLQPVVARLAVKDHAVVQATIERIAAKAGATLPAMATRDGRSYWKVDIAAGSIVIALADNQLITAVGTAPEVEAKLGLILGSDKPAQSMADGRLVKELMARHGLGGQMIGFADTRTIAGKALEAAGAAPSAACTAELDRLSAKVPRVVFGYGELSASRASGALVVELAPDVVTDLKALRVELPGLAATLSGQPIMTMGVGIDLARGQQVGVAVAEHLKQLGTACANGPLADAADQASRALSRPLPEPAGRISGGVVAIKDIKFATGAQQAIPESVEAVMMIASPDARALFKQAVELAAEIGTLGIVADGALHDLTIPLPVPFPIAAGVGDKAIVVTAGTQQKPLAVQLLAARGGSKAPLFAMTYDFSKVVDLELHTLGPALAAGNPAMPAVLRSMGQLLGRVSGTFDVTDHGVAVWSTVEIK